MLITISTTTQQLPLPNGHSTIGAEIHSVCEHLITCEWNKFVVDCEVLWLSSWWVNSAEACENWSTLNFVTVGYESLISSSTGYLWSCEPTTSNSIIS